MEKNIFAAIMLLAALAYSCVKTEFVDDNLDKEGEKVEIPTMSVADFVFEEDDPDTKTMLKFIETGVRFTFIDGERLGLFPYAVENAPQMPFFLTGIDATTCTLKCPGFALKAGVDYGAYYPYDYTDGLQATAVPVNYTGQTQTSVDGSTFELRADYLLANAKPKDGTCHFQMSHIGSLVIIDVTAPQSGTYAELSLNSESPSFVTSGTMDVGQSITLPSDGKPAQGIVIANTTTSDTISLTLGGDGGIELTASQTYRFCLMVAPVNLNSATLTLKLKNSSGVEYSTSISGKNFRQGYAYRYACSF